MEADEVTIREQNFHSQVREYTICFLLFAVLYIVSYFVITRYKRKADEQEDEDAIVNRISLFLSTFTLAVSAGAVLLLPFSIISNEILLSFPQNYYIQWLNGSLIHGLWNLASLFSNLCLFVLMPFAFFFLESEGFAGLKKSLILSPMQTETSLFGCSPGGSRLYRMDEAVSGIYPTIWHSGSQNEGAPSLFSENSIMDYIMYPDMLRLAKIPAPVLTAHSIRAQAASAAFPAQVPTQEICRVVTWSSVHTFTVHYAITQQARDDAAFGRAVLQLANP